MWEAVVVLVKPENVTCTRIVCATVSKSTSANPVPGDAFGGSSLGPVNMAVYTMGTA
jgi:hypothetical protein